jgi:hypothetical protein
LKYDPDGQTLLVGVQPLLLFQAKPDGHLLERVMQVLLNS